jgi:hypothetical protein
MSKRNNGSIGIIVVNIIELTGWYAQPVHCPFCGEAQGPHDTSSCKHLLYVIFAGNFLYRSERFENATGILSKDDAYWPELSTVEIEKYGTPEDIVQSTANKFSNLTEYQVDNVSDVAIIGYANLDTETVGWGLYHASPYATD